MYNLTGYKHAGYQDTPNQHVTPVSSYQLTEHYTCSFEHISTSRSTIDISSALKHLQTKITIHDMQSSNPTANVSVQQFIKFVNTYLPCLGRSDRQGSSHTQVQACSNADNIALHSISTFLHPKPAVGYHPTHSPFLTAATKKNKPNLYQTKKSPNIILQSCPKSTSIKYQNVLPAFSYTLAKVS